MAGIPLFPKIPKMLHGGDYAPEQWLDAPEIIDEDIRLMKLAKINTVTLGMFAWSVFEPEEGVFQFEWLDSLIDKLYNAGIYTILGTPGARGAWLDEKYPEALRVNKAGIRNKHGLRHSHCITSPAYREKVRILITKLAERYGRHPGLILWHISNELGGECYCELCQQRFREYLREKYNGDINKLNHEWWTTFWSHRFNSFEQIEPPMTGGDSSIHGLNLDWKRFTTWNMADYVRFEVRVLKEITPDIPFTTNYMCRYPALDYNELSKEIDIISWDSYPKWNNDYESLWETAAGTAFDHSMMRSLKRGKPFMLMESVMSQVNWHPHNKLQRPGIHALSSVQAIACGSDTVQYFQWRKGRGSYEQYHGAVIDHLGSPDTRVFKEVMEVGAILDALSHITSSVVKPKAAIIYDWPNRWAVEDAMMLSKEKEYTEVCAEAYAALMRLGIESDVISSDAELDGYSVVIAPMLYLLKPTTAENLKRFTENGGALIATYLLGYVNDNTLCYLGGFPGGGLRSVFGLYAEEIDALYPTETNTAIFRDNPNDAHMIRDICEIVVPETAGVLAVYGSDFYKGKPVVTVNNYGKGKAYYIAARLDRTGMIKIFKKACGEAGIPVRELPEGIEYHTREDDTHIYHFYLNWSRDERVIDLGGERKTIDGFGFYIDTKERHE